MHPYFEKKSRPIFVSNYEKTYNFPSHFHNYLEIAHCIQGRQCVKMGEVTYMLKSGDTLLISPNTVHEYVKYDKPYDGETKFVAIICNDIFFSESVPDIITKIPKNPLVLSENLSEDVVYAFSKMRKPMDDTQLLGWTFIIIAYLLKHIEFEMVSGEMKLPAEIVAYIDENFKEDITVKHIAKVFGYHPSYIAHIFCDQLKIPFRTYLGSIRSEYAASQIKTTTKSLTEIAYDAGFNSLNTFCRCFKKHFSKTPSQYKKECKIKHK